MEADLQALKTQLKTLQKTVDSLVSNSKSIESTPTHGSSPRVSTSILPLSKSLPIQQHQAHRSPLLDSKLNQFDTTPIGARDGIMDDEATVVATLQRLSQGQLGNVGFLSQLSIKS